MQIPPAFASRTPALSSLLQTPDPHPGEPPIPGALCARVEPKESPAVTDVDARADLSRLKLPELQALAAERGIAGASKLRKGELVDALSADDTQTSAADFAASMDEVSVDAPTDVVDDLAPESADDGEGVDVSTPSDDTVPVR